MKIFRERGFKHWCFLSIKAIKVIVHGYYVVLDLNHLPLKKKKGQTREFLKNACKAIMMIHHRAMNFRKDASLSMTHN